MSHEGAASRKSNLSSSSNSSNSLNSQGPKEKNSKNPDNAKIISSLNGNAKRPSASNTGYSSFNTKPPSVFGRSSSDLGHYSNRGDGTHSGNFYPR